MKRPTRIVILNDRSEALGGATSLALLSARLLQDAGYTVTYVTGDAGQNAGLPDTIHRIALCGKALLDQPAPKRVAAGLYNHHARALIRSVVDRLDTPDTVYHIHGWAQTLSPAAFHALRPVARRLVVHSHDFTIVCPNGTYFDFRKNAVCPLTPLSSACLATHCDKRRRVDKGFRVVRSILKNRLFPLGDTPALIAAIHPAMAPWLERAGVGRRRIRIVRNPVSPFAKTRVRAEANGDLLFIGRVQGEKGVDLAAEAARAAGRRLRVVGDGPDRARLAETYPEIVWEGWRAHGEIASLIGSARALIMPSRLPEPFGLVSLEALQSGVPLVAFSDAFVAAEAAARGAAFIASDRSPGALAAAVKALDDDARVAKASHIAFSECCDLAHTPESWRDALLDLYAELLEAAC